MGASHNNLLDSAKNAESWIATLASLARNDEKHTRFCDSQNLLPNRRI
ncbi:hypothetical protein ACWIUD_09630 [Helicobacter sp. 23-1044]